MTAKNRARPLLQDNAAKIRPMLATVPQVVSSLATAPPMRLAALPSEMQPRRFARVPTHAVGVHPEHREYPRATLKLPLRLHSVNHIHEDFPVTLVTRD